MDTGGNGAHMSGRQGVASSNLASPTVKDLVGADLLGCMKAPKTLKMGQLLRVAPTIWAYATGIGA